MMTCAQEAHKGACTNLPDSSRLAITACCYIILNTDQVNSAVKGAFLLSSNSLLGLNYLFDIGSRERKWDLVIH